MARALRISWTKQHFLNSCRNINPTITTQTNIHTYTHTPAVRAHGQMCHLHKGGGSAHSGTRIPHFMDHTALLKTMSTNNSIYCYTQAHEKIYTNTPTHLRHVHTGIIVIEEAAARTVARFLTKIELDWEIWRDFIGQPPQRHMREDRSWCVCCLCVCLCVSLLCVCVCVCVCVAACSSASNNRGMCGKIVLCV